MIKGAEIDMGELVDNWRPSQEPSRSLWIEFYRQSGELVYSGMGHFNITGNTQDGRGPSIHVRFTKKLALGGTTTFYLSGIARYAGGELYPVYLNESGRFEYGMMKLFKYAYNDQLIEYMGAE